MDNEKRAANQEQLKSHSLPGTNQAGREAGDCEDDNETQRTGRDDERDELREDDSQEAPAKATHEDDRSRH
jgi:hypothetical protein